MSKFHLDTEYPEMVYLRPAPETRPVKTIESIEQAGMVLDHAHAIAMYTSRSVPNVGPAGPTGPQGPPGETGPAAEAVYDTIIASCSDEDTPLTVNLTTPKTTFRAPYPFDMTNGYVRISLTTEPLGSVLEVDLKMNGTSIFSVPLQIDAGERTSVTATQAAVLNVPANTVPDDAEFTVFVTKVGSTFAGAGLKIALTGQKISI